MANSAASKGLSVSGDTRKEDAYLSLIRERCGLLNRQLFEVCLKMQKEFEQSDLQRALLLASEFNSLKACEDELEHLKELRRETFRALFK